MIDSSETKRTVKNAMKEAAMKSSQSVRQSKTKRTMDTLAVISEKNVGYKLLKRAGWREGKGLGIHEQGRLVPLQAVRREAQEGLGYRTKEVERAEASKTWKDDVATPRDQTKTRMPVLSEQVCVLLDAADKEDQETKRKRIKQTMETEVRDEVSKHIAKAVYRAFRDDDGAGRGDDDNPLIRRTRSSTTNPLL